MKKLSVSLMCLCFATVLSTPIVKRDLSLNRIPLKLEDTWMISIMDVESNRNPKIKSNGDAVGILQIRPIMVKDLNKKEGYRRFTLSDRRDSLKSVEMFKCFLRHYNVCSLEQASRKWNGGPTGMEKRSTVPYYNKVLQRYRFYKGKTYGEI